MVGTMKLHAQIVGFIDGKSVNASAKIDLRKGETVKALLKRADKCLGSRAGRPFKRAFRQGIEPVILVNGDRVELSQIKAVQLKDGDQVNVILAVAGG